MAYTTINKPSDYFKTQAYTGSGSTKSISSLNFQPDWVWIKSRNSTAWHNLYDSVRGATKDIYSNATDVEGTNTNRLTSFDSNGFSVGNDSDVNADGTQYISWNWKANGTGVSNTDGDITSTVSANTTTGFSIVKYTGNGSNDQRIGHGLGVRPVCWMIKRLDTADDWVVYHHGIASNWYDDTYLYLNSTNGLMGAVNTGTGNPTSSVFYIGNSAKTGASGGEYIAYVFAEKTGFSKFDSYIGDGDTDGQFIYTGFKPAFVMYKKVSASGNDWIMADRVRASAVNPLNKELYANSNSTEGTVNLLDFTSNGFKLRRSHASQNENGAKYIYMCFAKSPLVASNNVPATAR